MTTYLDAAGQPIQVGAIVLDQGRRGEVLLFRGGPSVVYDGGGIFPLDDWLAARLVVDSESDAVQQAAKTLPDPRTYPGERCIATYDAPRLVAIEHGRPLAPKVERNDFEFERREIVWNG